MATNTKFNGQTTGKEVVEQFFSGVKGRTFLITGPSVGGIGETTAYSLSLAHPKALFLAGRSISKIQPLIDRINIERPAVCVHFIQLDLDDISSVRTAATTIQAFNIPVDVIINNAGIMFCPFALSPQGIESQFATNHIGHFLLTKLLLPLVKSGGRIVNVSSSGHYFSGIRFTDPNFTNGYDFADAYGQAKTANILHAKSLAERLQDKKITAFSVHPGSITTGLQAYVNPETIKPVLARAKEIWPEEFARASFGRERKTLEQGCSTTLVAALDPALEEHNGSFLFDCQIADHLVAEHAKTLDDAEKLWKLSEHLIDSTFSVD